MRILDKSSKVRLCLCLFVPSYMYLAIYPMYVPYIQLQYEYTCVHACLENEVDGEVFLLLTDEDMGEMVKPLGARRKLITKRNMLTCVSTFVACYIFS